MSLFKTIIKTLILVCLISSSAYSQTSSQTNTKAGATKKYSKKKVEVFVTSWCPYCKKLENELDAKGITYIRYDIEKSEKGLKLYQQMGMTGGVPVAKITTYKGTQIVRGANTLAIVSALN